VSDAKLRAWVQNWIELGPILEAIRRRELEAMTDDDARREIAALFTGWRPPASEAAVTSGLVEQQRWFSMLRARGGM